MTRNKFVESIQLLVFVIILLMTSVPMSSAQDSTIVEFVQDIDVSQDGSLLAISYGPLTCDAYGNGNARTEIVTADSLQAVAVIDLPNGTCFHRSEISPSGDEVAISTPTRLSVWDIDMNEEVFSTSALIFNGTDSLSWNSDGAIISGTYGGAGFIANYDIQTGNRFDLGTFGPLTTLSWHPTDPNLLAIATVEGRIEIRDREGTLISQRDVADDAITNIQWSPNGEFILVTASNSRLGVYDYNQSSLNIVEAWSPDEHSVIANTIWSPDSQIIAAISRDGFVALYGAVNGEELDNLPSSDTYSLAVAILVNGNGSYDILRGGAISTGEESILVDSIEIMSITQLRLTSLCSPDPDRIRVWRVRNTNPDPVDFTWDVVGTDQTGSGTVPGGSEATPGEVTFQTVTVDGPNTTRIFVDGEQQNVKASTPDACD